MGSYSGRKFLGLISIGTVASALGSLPTLSKEVVAATGLTPIFGFPGVATLGAALASTAGQIVLGVEAGRIGARSGAKPGESINHDLTKASGWAISSIIESALPVRHKQKRRQLAKLAAAVMDAHDPAYREFSEPSVEKHIAEGLLDDKAGVLQAEGPDEGYWVAFLHKLCEERSIGTGLIRKNIERIAQALVQSYPQKLFEALKENAAGDGKAFAGAVLRQLNTIMASLSDIGQGNGSLEKSIHDFRAALAPSMVRTAEVLDELATKSTVLSVELRNLHDTVHSEVERLVSGQVRIKKDTERILSSNGRIERILSELREKQETLATSPIPSAVEAVDGPLRLPAVPPLPMGLIGREGEIAKVVDLFDSGARQVSLLGAPGAGKTSLARAISTQLMSTRESLFPNGCCVVQFASLQDPLLVVQEIVEQFLVKMPSSVSNELQYLEELLRPLSVLVVLDNCEHLLDACREALNTMARCPNIRVIATSRRRIRSELEVPFPVSELDCPDKIDQDNWDRVAASAAVQLFVRTAAPFELTEDNAPQVARLVRGVAGLPLAVELLAARTLEAGIASLANDAPILLSRLGRIPEGEDRGGKTMEETIRFSYDLLSRKGQDAFRRLACFDGGWDNGAEAAVLPPESEPIVARLVDANLVRQDPRTERRSLLEPIRQFASRIAIPEELKAAREAHAGHFASLAEELSSGLLEGDRDALIDRLEIEHDNFRRAINWSGSHGKVHTVLRLVAALWRFWEPRGYLVEGRRMVKLALECEQGKRDESDVTMRLRLQVLLGDLTLAYRMGEATESLKIAIEAKDLAHELGDAASEAAALNDMGNAYSMLGRYAESNKAIAQSLEGHEIVLRQLEQDCDRELKEAGSVGASTDRDLKYARRQIAVANFNLGAHHFQAFETEVAYDYLETALLGFQADGNLHDVPYPLTLIGLIYAFDGSTDLARACLEQAIELRAGSPVGLGESLEALGHVAMIEHDYPQALGIFRRAWKHASDAGAKKVLAKVLDSLAYFSFAADHPELGVRVLSAADEFRTKNSISRWGLHKRVLDKALLEVSGRLDEKRLKALVRFGKLLTPEKAADEVFRLQPV